MKRKDIEAYVAIDVGCEVACKTIAGVIAAKLALSTTTTEPKLTVLLLATPRLLERASHCLALA